MKDIACKYQTFLLLLSGRRKQTSHICAFFLSLYKFKSWFLLQYCVAIMTLGFIWSCLFSNLEMTKAFFLWKWLSYTILFYYTFTPNSVVKSVPPNASEPTWQTSMLYSGIISLIYVKKKNCMVICPSSRFKLIIVWPRMSHLMPRLSQNISYGWGALVPLWVLKHSSL